MNRTTCLVAVVIAATAAANPKSAQRLGEEPAEVAAAPGPLPSLPVPEPLPGARAFGIRAGLGGSTATPGIDVGNVGAKFMVTDGLFVSADVGIGLTAASGYSAASFAADAVLGIYLRNRGASLRPYVPLLFGVGFSSRTEQMLQQIGSTYYPVSTQAGGISLALGGGIGAEYWFSSYFSVAAELMFRLSATNLNPFTIQIGTLTPGVHATYWF